MADKSVGDQICDGINAWLTEEEAIDAEKARCLAIATDLLTRGPGFPCSSEFADGYSLAAQELVAGITGSNVVIAQEPMRGNVEHFTREEFAARYPKAGEPAPADIPITRIP